MEKQLSVSQELAVVYPCLLSLPDSCHLPSLTLGVVGNWKEHLTPEMNEKFNAVYQSKMGDSGLCLPWTMD